MPRLTNGQYIERREQLRLDWQEGGQEIRRLSLEQQWSIHDFYLPGQNLPESELIARRDAAIEQEPDLAKRAGLAYRSFAASYPREQQAAPTGPTPAAQLEPVVLTQHKTRGQRIVVWSDPDHVPDMKRLAETLLAIGKEQAAQAKRRD